MTASIPARRAAASRVPIALLALATPSLAVAALAADNEPRSVIVGGAFEHGAVSLRLGAVSPFPLVVGGWGARLDQGAVEIVDRDDGSGRALQVESAPRAPAYALQDVALASRAFVFDIDLMRQRGQQSIALLGEWDRMDLETDAALRIELRGASLRVRTPDGSWRVDHGIARDEWVSLRLVSDPRLEQLHLFIDGSLVAALPTTPATAVRTLVLGGNPGSRPSRFRYDDARLLRLTEIELAELRREAIRHVPEPELDAVMRRLDDAARALGAGAERLAGAELRAVARLLDRIATGDEAQPEVAQLTVAAAAVAELVATR